MKKHPIDLILAPLITEKSSKQEKLGKYFFQVRPQATKGEIREAVEELFNVHVTKVNTSMAKRKWKRVRHRPGQTSLWKKAVVTLKEGEKITLA